MPSPFGGEGNVDVSTRAVGSLEKGRIAGTNQDRILGTLPVWILPDSLDRGFAGRALMPIHPKFAAAVKAMAASNADKHVVDEIVADQDVLPGFGVNTPRKIAHFLAQIATNPAASGLRSRT